MANSNRKNKIKQETRKRVFGIKLPPIEQSSENEVRTILDIDPEHYSSVDGRPIRPTTSSEKYKHDIKEIALKKVLLGFVTDEILRIDTEIENETNVYDTAFACFEECQKSFNKFLAYDNDKTIDVMKKSDALSKGLTNQTEEYKNVFYEMTTLKSKLQYIDESLLILLTYQHFLHTASPALWQQKESIVLNLKHTEIFYMDTNVFNKINIEQIKEKLQKLSSPHLFFERPDQLLNIFEYLEKQNTDYLLITEELNSEKIKFIQTAEKLKKILHEELEYMQQKINETEQVIARNALREEELKEIFYRILNEKIKHLVSSKKILQIYNYVEYAYEHIIAPNDVKLDTLSMMSAIKSEYDNLLLDLTALNVDIVKEIEKETYDNQVEEMKRAVEANRLLKDVNKMSKRLKATFEPTRRNNSDSV